MSQHAPRLALRELLASPGCTVAPGAYDALSARLVERAGFDAVYLTGGGFARANGLPDLGLLTMTEIVGWITQVVETVSIPVIADADTGYGNALNVVRTVRAFERAGVAGFHLEDQVAPKRCGHYESKQVVPTDEMVVKIRAAVDTRQDTDLLIIARTDALAIEGIDGALDRIDAYLEAGADIGFVEAPTSRAELEDIPRRQPRACLTNVFEGGRTPPLPADELGAMGYRLAIYPSQTQRAAIAAMQRVLGALRTDGHTQSVENELSSFAEREEVVGGARWQSLGARYSDTTP